MGLPELKNKVLMYIENADENQLAKVSDIFENNTEYKTIENSENIISEPVVAYDVLGKPLTLKQYNEEIDKGIDDFENGRTISHEDLLKEIKSWRNEV
jgi:predicted transcriptional regulator